MDLLHRVQNLIEEKRMLERGDGVIVGCSGGADSLCLLDLFLRLRMSMELTVRVVHLEHGFRGRESEADARFVEDFCARHGVECSTYRENVSQQARNAGISQETAGREARYRRFFEEKEMLQRRMEVEATRQNRECAPRVKIATAHNRNDQAETVLMRIMRGTGLEGLKGMELVRGDGLIRPLLTTDRAEIEAYCAQRGLQPRQDRTNLETNYTRNRIRLELIPYMKEHFNENVEEALCRLGRIAEEDQAVILAQARDLQDACEGKRRALAELSDGLRHQVVRLALEDRGLTADVSAVHLEQIDSLLKSEAASGTICLPRGYRVSVAYDQVFWEIPDGRATFPQGRLTSRQVSRSEIDSIEELKRLPKHRRCFDGDKIRKALEEAGQEELTLRFRQPGDFIRPLGSAGRKKLQDWLVDRKIPRRQRDSLPVVCIGNEVVWIVGHQISENYKVDIHSKKLIFVEFHQ